ncbi:Fur family transcriptional regulator [Actinophytocola sp.]|uniref:Fur family transcriptional regulator n=1 Tax=Actinophytocola sp. TaxID=1872138 RepID=UPI002D7E861D|nr:Fur family transcriptional regulator [Actinophytocola sp.]HET9143405.1 Fur family transcriptional regulator [Actinophytocola sp.]HEU5110380.1 Fur family transcriptional regulator [Micromonosporaceae bacterium]
MNDQGLAQQEPRERLRAVGLRVTAPRIAVLEWLATNPHATAEEIAAGVRERLDSVSTQAIYDVLNACTRARLLRRIEPAGHPARFETRTSDNHHHLVCRMCHRTEDVDCVVGLAPCLEPSSSAGFVLDEAEVVFWGLCPVCAGRPQTESHHIEESA